MPIGWNLVYKNLPSSEQLGDKIRQKISKLERHLAGFSQHACYLHIALEKLPRKPEVKSILVLRLPAHVLKSQKTGRDAIAAVDKGVKALMRELEAAKAHIRKESSRRRAAQRHATAPREETAFEPAPAEAGMGPQNATDVISDLLNRHYDRLRKYIFRQVEHVERGDEIPRGVIDTRAIVDEVARRALAAPNSKPPGMTYQAWIYALARDEFEAQCSRVAYQKTRTFPIERAERTFQDNVKTVIQPIDAIQQQLEPDLATREVQGETDPADSPDKALERKELIQNLRDIAATWAESERDVFDLHFLEGLDANQIAMIQNRAKTEVDDEIRLIQNRLEELSPHYPWEFTEAAEKRPAARPQKTDL